VVALTLVVAALTLVVPALAVLPLEALALPVLPLAVATMVAARDWAGAAASIAAADTRMVIDTVAIGPTGAGALLLARSPRRGRTITAMVTTPTVTTGTATRRQPMTVASRAVCSALSPTIRPRAPISAMMAIAIRARDRISERPPRGGLSLCVCRGFDMLRSAPPLLRNLVLTNA
jgi:hypothetical protein